MLANLVVRSLSAASKGGRLVVPCLECGRNGVESGAFGLCKRCYMDAHRKRPGRLFEPSREYRHLLTDETRAALEAHEAATKRKGKSSPK